MPEGKICSVEGCGRPVLARGWCTAHYGRWYRHGDVEVDRPIRTLTRRGSGCAVEGCESPDETRGWCGIHYRRWARWGDPEATPAPTPPQPCGTNAAYQRHIKRGEPVCDLCRAYDRWHWRTVMRLGTAEIKRLGLTYEPERLGS